MTRLMPPLGQTLVLAALALPLALPQGALAENPRVNVQVFRPSPHDADLVMTRGARVRSHLSWSAALLANYGADALVFEDAGSTGLRDEVIQDQVTLDLMGSISLFDRLSIGLALPLFVLNQGEDGGFVPTDPVESFAVGDLRVAAKFAILETAPADSGFGLAVTLEAGLPTGDAGSFVSDGFTIVPGLAADLRVGPARFALNLGYRFRSEERLPLTEPVGHDLVWGAGAEVDVIAGELSALGELYGSAGDFSDANLIHMEGILGVRYRIPGVGVSLTAGGGAGFLDGYGNTSLRLFFGVAYAPSMVGDKDGDGIPDDRDECPSLPEDHDGFADEDGCPDDDNDGDGIKDAVDKCPNEPEDKDGFEDEDGCPDVDNDGDGIPDIADKCPNDAEDMDGIEDEDGCPEIDADGDEILDPVDKCPTDPEDKDGFEDEDGCPDLDNDGDGIPDAEDPCPMDPTNKCGVSVNPCEIVIAQKIFFEYDSDVIKKQSFPILNAVASVLLSRASLKVVEIQGHTDSKGVAAYNLELSHRRAEAVRTYLAAKGVAQDRMVAKGYGETTPLGTNRTKAGRSKNRRVQFVITDPPQTDCK